MEARKLRELKELIEELRVVEKEEIVSEKRFIASKSFACHLANGEIIRREQLLKGGLDGSAALILPVTSEGNVILTVEPRVFTKRSIGVSVPAGYIEKGERPSEAAVRELMEETGFKPKEMIYLGGFYQDMGVSSAYNHSFLAKDVEKVGEQNLDDGEFVKYFMCTFEDALELIDLGYIEGSNAIITLERAKKVIRKVR